jgi:hypothetical protein
MNAFILVNSLLGEAVWNSFVKRKYGLRNCEAGNDDIIGLYELKNLHISETEKVSLGELENPGCGINRLEEKINTL